MKPISHLQIAEDRPQADVSIIAANYNNGEYLDDFIKSVIESSVWPKELIIVDDGSTDHSHEVLKSYERTGFIRPFFFDRNRGFTTAMNVALEKASCKYVMRADPDDLFHPERIEKQVAFLEQNPDVDLIGCNCTYFSGKDLKLLNASNFPLQHNRIVSAYYKGEHGLLHATVCGKRQVYQQYRYQAISPGEDYELFARMAKDGRQFANLKDALAMVRVHPGSSTSRIQLDAIAQTFRFRDQIFGTNTSRLKIRMYYWHIWHYRKSQLSDNLPRKYAHLLAAVCFYPVKLIRRIHMF